MKKVLKVLGEGAIYVVIIALGIGLGITLILPLMKQSAEKVAQVVDPTFGTRGFSQLKPFAFNDTNGSATSTIVGGFNTMDIGTTTPTSTDYLFIGNQVDQVDMYLWVNVTSTDNGVVEWKISFSPTIDINNTNTSTMNFFFEDSNSISSSLVTHVADDVVHRLTPGDSNADLKKVSICGKSTDSAANTKISQCNAGVYKIEIGRPDVLSGFQLHAVAAIKMD